MFHTIGGLLVKLKKGFITSETIVLVIGQNLAVS